MLQDTPAGYAAHAIEHSRIKDVDLICADDTLMDLDLTKVEQGAASAANVIQFVNTLAGAEMYDWLIIDCPPAFNAASAAALAAVQEVIIPMKIDAFSLRGLGNIMQQISNMRKLNPKLRLSGILPTMWYKSDNIISAEKQLRDSALPVFPHIRRTAKADDMTFAQEPIITCSPKSAAAVDYRQFVESLMKGVQ